MSQATLTVRNLYPSTLIIPDRAPTAKAPTPSHIIPACIEGKRVAKRLTAAVHVHVCILIAHCAILDVRR